MVCSNLFYMERDQNFMKSLCSGQLWYEECGVRQATDKMTNNYKKIKDRFSLKRKYLPDGTNGQLWLQQQLICIKIELLWKENKLRKSCIPEGCYTIKKRSSQKFGEHFLITNVPNRSMILIYPANHAKTELQGCIAPVTKLTGEGRGELSRKAFTNFKTLVNDKLDRDQKVILMIKSKQHDNY